MSEEPTAAAGVAPDDEALMQRFCQGDESAFESLYARHAPNALAFLRRMVRDDALAEDLLQVTFLSFVRARGRYEPRVGVRAWMFAIAANAGRDALRRRKTRREVELSPTVSATLSAPDAGAPDPRARERLREALQQLPVDQREAVVLHHLQGLPFEEVATAVGASLSAAKVRAHRGYEKLRAILGPEAALDAAG